MLSIYPVTVGSTYKMANVANTAQLVALWLHNKSQQSQRSYEYDVRCFISFLLSCDPGEVRLNDLDLRSVTLNDVQAFADCLENQKLAASTRARRLAAVKSLLKFGHECEYLHFNAALRTKLPKPKDTLAQRILSELEVMTLIALSPMGRDRLIIQLLYYTGARVGEVAKLTWRDVKVNRDGHGQVTLYGKGDKTRTVIIPQDLYQGLLAEREGDNPDAPVFKSRKGKKPLQERQVRKVVNDAAKRAGFKGNVSPHFLRHSHASHSLDRGASPQLVSATLGHSSLQTTSRYAHARPSDSSGLYLPR